MNSPLLRRILTYRRELCIVAVVVVLASWLVGTGQVTKRSIAQDKDFFAAIASAVSLIAIVLGAAVSYLKFFRGRTLSPRLALVLADNPVKVTGGNLHALEIEIRNVGTVPVWDHSIEIFVQFHDEPSEPMRPVTDFAQWPVTTKDGKPLQNVIDIAESAYEHAFYFVPARIQACTFRVTVTTPDHSRWSRCLTVGNYD